MPHKLFRSILLSAVGLSLAACGGGGGGPRLTTTPPPPPPPPPAANDTSVELLETPPAGELATLAAGDPIQIRYDAVANQYEVLAGGENWAALVDNPWSNNGGSPNLHFVLASRQDWPEGSRFSIDMHHRSPAATSRYRYSNLASWSLRRAGPMGDDEVRGGTVAFGSATPEGRVPVTGIGSYEGYIKGQSTVTATSGWGDQPNAPVRGAVSLRFDFGSGSLTGQMSPSLACDCNPINFPTLKFTDIVFGVGSRTFSGRFDTNVSGSNSFSGLFTGPKAEELIGRWAFPFIHGGSTHSATGAWVAKTGQ